MIELEDRVLTEDGISIITVNKAAEIILDTGELGDNFKVLECEDALQYESKYGINITYAIEEFMALPPSPDIEISELSLSILHSSRWMDDAIYQDRYDLERKFFYDNDQFSLLIKLDKLIRRFKHDGVVWSGRGSSCASYVLYLLEVHDVDPVKYNIPFYEFSKDFEGE